MTEDKEKPIQPKKGVSRREFIAGTVGGVVVGAVVGAAAGSLGFPRTITQTKTQTTTATTTSVTTAQPWLPAKWDYTADVAVIGGGGGGSIAAIAAYDAGAKVIILEKQAADTATAIHQTSSTRQSNSGQTCWLGTEADGVKYCKYCLGQLIPDDVITSLVDQWMGYNTWLTKNGMDSKVFTTTTTPATGGGPIQSISMAGVAPTDSPSMPWGGAVYWNFLTKNLASRGAGIQVLYGTPAQHLVYNPVTQEVIGVEASTSGGSTIYVRANKAVVVACGGFEQDSPRKFNTYFGLNFEFEDNPGSTGDGYAMLEDLGADLWNTVWSSTRLSLDDVHLPGVGAGVSLTMPSTSSTPGGAIKVDQYGSRFLNETTTGAPVLAAVQYWDSTYHLYPRNPSWFIFDEPWRTGATPLGGSVIQSTLGIYAFSTGGVNEIAKGWILKGATLDELAANINAAPNTFTLMSPNNTGLMSANTLKATVSSWNGYCTAGSDPLGRPKATLTAFASTGPYYAAAIFPGAQESYGGARKNGKGQVLRSDGSVIKRAYEAGELGLTSTVSGSPISAMTETAFSGLIAGTNAAAETPWS